MPDAHEDEILKSGSRARRLIDGVREAPMLMLLIIVIAAIGGMFAGLALSDEKPDPLTASSPPEALFTTNAISGQGPFLVFARPEAGRENSWIISASDLSGVVEDLARPAPSPTEIGRVEGFLTSHPLQVNSGAAVAVFAHSDSDAPTTSGWFVRRDRTFGRPAVTVPGPVDSWVASPDGTKAAAFVALDAARQDAWRLCRWAVATGASECTSALPKNAYPVEGSPTIVSWLASSDEILEYPVCACDYSFDPVALVVSPKGAVRPLPWLRLSTASRYFASADGSLLVYEGSSGNRDETRTLLLADLRSERIRTLATTRELQFVSPVISARGRRVAHGSGLAGEIVIRTTKGEIEATLDFPAGEIAPLAFLGEDTLIFAARNPDPEDTSHGEVRLVKATFRDGNWGTPGIIASGRDLFYLGWLK